MSTGSVAAFSNRPAGTAVLQVTCSGIDRLTDKQISWLNDEAPARDAHVQVEATWGSTSA